MLLLNRLAILLLNTLGSVGDLCYMLNCTSNCASRAHNIIADISQFSPLNTLSDQLGPNIWVLSVFIIVQCEYWKIFFLKSEYRMNVNLSNFIIF